jgi:hypothetical protein
MRDLSEWIHGFSSLCIAHIHMSNTREMTATKCIYCQNTEGISREHVIPDALLARTPNDAWIIQKGSCLTCQKAINVYETDTIRSLYKGLRHATGVKKGKLEVFSFDGISIPDAYAVVCPVFSIPTELTGAHINPNIRVREVVITVYDPKRLFANTLRNVKKETLLGEVDFSPANFMKMLAKIAYGFCVLHYGEDFFARSPLPAIARGTADHTLSQYVGSITRKERDEKLLVRNEIRTFRTQYHEVNVVEISSSIVTIVKLFSQQSREVDYAVVSANT